MSFLLFSPRLPSSLFFQYNEQLGPPFHVLMDTNFINFSVKNKLDIVQSMMDCLYAKCQSHFLAYYIRWQNRSLIRFQVFPTSQIVFWESWRSWAVNSALLLSIKESEINDLLLQNSINVSESLRTPGLSDLSAFIKEPMLMIVLFSESIRYLRVFPTEFWPYGFHYSINVTSLPLVTRTWKGEFGRYRECRSCT